MGNDAGGLIGELSMSSDDGEQIGSAGTSDGLNGAPRIRRNTLERFNDELSVLDRPLETDVEYYDEEPPSKRPRMVAIAAALFVIGGVGAGFPMLSGHIGGATPSIELAVAPPAAAIPTPVLAPSPSPPPPVAAPPEPALAEIEPDAEPAVDAVPSDASSIPIAVAPSPWTRMGKPDRSSHGRGGHRKPTR
jgi:hypothetical protein